MYSSYGDPVDWVLWDIWMEIEHFKMLIILGNIVAIHKQVILCIGWYGIVVFVYL